MVTFCGICLGMDDITNGWDATEWHHLTGAVVPCASRSRSPTALVVEHTPIQILSPLATAVGIWWNDGMLCYAVLAFLDLLSTNTFPCHRSTICRHAALTNLNHAFLQVCDLLIKAVLTCLQHWWGYRPTETMGNEEVMPKSCLKSFWKHGTAIITALIQLMYFQNALCTYGQPLGFLFIVLWNSWGSGVCSTHMFSSTVLLGPHPSGQCQPLRNLRGFQGLDHSIFCVYTI